MKTCLYRKIHRYQTGGRLRPGTLAVCVLSLLTATGTRADTITVGPSGDYATISAALGGS